MTAATSPAILRARAMRDVPLRCKQAVNSAVLDDIFATAFANNWTDASWLAGLALIGVDHPAIKDPAALFVSQLRSHAAMPCPAESTPEPPSITELRRRKVIVEHTPHPCPDDARQRINQALGRRTA